MKRRSFITTGALAATALGSFQAISCSDDKKVAPAAEDSPASAKAFALEEATIGSLQEQMKSGQYSAAQLVDLYLARIRDIDQHGHSLRAVIELNPDAVQIAALLDEERRNGKLRGPLHGIPVFIKDNIDTGDKMHTTAGALAMASHIAREDAALVKKLRAAGAVILGKTNLSEWANFRSSNSCSGWSSRGGQTKSPYVLDHNPCGSSSGSGVAVSANLCVVAIGTETDGSITCPSSTNAIVGIKPTVGLVSRTGMIPISATQDTAGPMARTVTDAAILLGVLTGVDDADAATKESEGKFKTDYTVFLDRNALKGKRIGVEKKPQGKNQYMHQLQAKAMDVLRQQGAEVIELEYLEQIGKMGDAEFEVLQFEFKDGLNRYLSKSGAPMKSLADVIAFNIANEDKAMPYFKQETLQSSQAKPSLDSDGYRKALKNSHEGSRAYLNELMEKNRLDALTGLTMGPSCSIDMIYGDRWGDVFLTQPAAISGYPHISVPCGQVYGLPVGLSFFGRAYSEPVLIGIAYAYEQASKNRVPPAFRAAFIA